MKRTTIGLAAGALLLAAGCSGEAGGQAEPAGGPSAPTSSAATSGSAPQSSTSESSSLPHSGAPRVADPLPESVLSDDACDALTTEQLSNALGKAAPGQPKGLPIGPSCDWSNPESFTGITVAYSVESREGLSAQYANTKPKTPSFQETDPVLGFPAIQYQLEEGSDGCTVAVGLADEYSVTVVVTQSEGSASSDPCNGAARVAQDVVGNLKGKA